MTPSVCENCKNMREVRTARSRFLLCELSVTNAAYAKYPPQPILRCGGYEARQVAKAGDEDPDQQPLSDTLPLRVSPDEAALPPGICRACQIGLP
jgi:hypothetical protein